MINFMNLYFIEATLLKKMPKRMQKSLLLLSVNRRSQNLEKSKLMPAQEISESDDL